jgi:hypothetical protein
MFGQEIGTVKRRGRRSMLPDEQSINVPEAMARLSRGAEGLRPLHPQSVKSQNHQYTDSCIGARTHQT